MGMQCTTSLWSAFSTCLHAHEVQGKLAISSPMLPHNSVSPHFSLDSNGKDLKDMGPRQAVRDRRKMRLGGVVALAHGRWGTLSA